MVTALRAPLESSRSPSSIGRLQIVDFATSQLSIFHPENNGEPPFAGIGGSRYSTVGSVVCKVTSLSHRRELFATQHRLPIEIRRSRSHDRYVFIDGVDGYHSSASFQDGGGKSVAMLSQITDAFDATKQIYETEWSGAAVVRAP
jgi:hypothetical protein